MLTQAGREGTNGENLGSIPQSLQAFLMVRAEITYSVIGNWTKKGGGKKSIHLLLCCSCSVTSPSLAERKALKNPTRAVNGAFLWVYSGFADPDLG